MPSDLPEPWRAFLTELDSTLKEPIELHCLGGFVVSILYGLDRPTSDVDILAVRPNSAKTYLQDTAGNRSPLFKKHRVHLQIVTVIYSYPENYEERLTDVCQGCFRNLRLLALDPYDLALSKLERNSPRDREDVRHLAKAIPLDPEVLRDRYQQEMRPHIANVDREDLTLRLWTDMIEEERQRNL